MQDKFTGIEAATAFAKVLSEDMDTPFSLKIGPEICYNASTGEMTLPGVPADNIPEQDQNRFRAYHGHESMERGHRKISLGPIRERGEPMLATLMNAQGDVMLDNLATDKYPGLGMHIKDAVREDSQEMLAIGPQVAPSGNSLGSVIRHIGEKVVTYDEAYGKLPQLQPYMDKVEDELRNLETQDEEKIYDQCKRMYRVWKELEEDEPPPPPGEGEDEEEGEGGGEGEGKGGKGLPNEAPDDWDHEQNIKNRTQNGLMGSKMGKNKHPEYSSRHGEGAITTYSFNPKHDRIAQAKDMSNYLRVPKDWERDAQVLRNRLAQALTVQAPNFKRRLLKGEVDERNLHRLCIGDSDVMKRRLRQETSDVSVSLSMDMSGSMSHNILLIKHMCKIWIDALGRLGIDNEVLGWHGGRSDYLGWSNNDYRYNYRVGPITHLLIKQFNQQYNDPEVANNIAHLEADGGTPTGEGLFFAAQRLAARPARRKVLFFMSDGQPALATNGPLEVHYEFTRTVAKRCASSGIELIPVGLGDYCNHIGSLLPEHTPLMVKNIREVESKLTHRLTSYLRKESLEQVRR